MITGCPKEVVIQSLTVRLGRSRADIFRDLALLNLKPEIQELVKEEKG